MWYQGIRFAVPVGVRADEKRWFPILVPFLNNTQSMICGFKSWLATFLQTNGKVKQGKSLSGGSEIIPQLREIVFSNPLNHNW